MGGTIFNVPWVAMVLFAFAGIITALIAIPFLFSDLLQKRRQRKIEKDEET